MRLMEEIFFSFTFGGETLSLAAALATLHKLRREPVIETLRRQGRKVIDGVQALITRYGIEDILAISGDPAWSFLNVKEVGAYSSWQIKTFLLQEWFARGILCLGTHNMSYAHGDNDIARLLAVHDEVFAAVGSAVRNRDLESRLRCKPLEPLFKVR
jgi:glutamate-1-semialdehyde 2,1-aminomutase